MSGEDYQVFVITAFEDPFTKKYFISTIINKIGNKVMADSLAGHKISDVDRAYKYMDLKNRYLSALP
jgi:hypothetical protein